MPPYLSTDTKILLSSMLVVDPLKRITIQEIRFVILNQFVTPLKSNPTKIEKTLGLIRIYLLIYDLYRTQKKVETY